MIAHTLEIEGTWEEIAAQTPQFVGRKMRLTVLPEVLADVSETSAPVPKNCRSIEEKIAEILAKVPEEELAKFPTDIGDNLDHYIYGTRKR